jgi:predicted metal-dependent hydrolase
MEREGRTTITVSRSIKDRFLEFVGAPKRFGNADEALTTLLDSYETKDKRGKLQEETVDGVHSG